MVAVPVWMGGAVVSGAGALSTAVGEGATKAGNGAMRGAEKMWDFAADDTAARPKLDRTRSVPPPTTSAAPARPAAKDPSPAEAMKRL